MKLGVDTVSLNNYLVAGTEQPEPKVGDGGTVCMWTDRVAVTIVKVTPTTVTVQRDTAVRTDHGGMSDQQSYEYRPNPVGVKYVFRKTKEGWRNKSLGLALVVGVRKHYHDYSF